MRYKIDTRENFDVITPLYGEIDSILSDQMNDLLIESRENGRSLLIDMVHVFTLNEANLNLFESMHHEMYQDNLSMVFCHIHTACKQAIAEANLEHVLNITPTLAEAVDLISMEGLERELLGGE